MNATTIDPDRRWLRLLHVLFGVSLGVPTAVVAASGEPGTPLTVAIATAFAAWYAALAGTMRTHTERGARAVLYAAGALAFYTALNIRDDFYFLLIYSLLPQFFSMLPRSLAVGGVAGMVLLPAAVSGNVGELLRSRGALFSLLAAVGLGLAITAIIEALSRQSHAQRATIAELERARADNERLLAAARRDAADRAALARVGHALIAARSPDDVVAAIAEQLAGHSADVRGVALLTEDAMEATVVATVGGAAGPAVSAAVSLPRRAEDGVAVVLSGDELSDTVPTGVDAVALLSLRGTADDHATRADRGEPTLLWVGLGSGRHDEATLRDLSTVAAGAALALANLRLAARAAEQGRTAGILAERQRLAHEIHDTLAQGFTSIVTQLEAAEQALGDGTIRAATHLERAKRMARDSLGEARRTVEALRPEPLDRVGLPAALEDLATRWRDGQSRPPTIAVTIDGEPVRVPPSVDDALLRVAREALTNIERHAEARAVDVTLSYVDNVVVLDVQDDGVGFDVGTTAARADVSDGGYGLTAMRERVTLLGGTLAVESAPGDGTTIAATVPRLPAAVAPSPGTTA